MSKLKRREFLVGGATAIVGLTYFKDIKAALAAARRSGKPLLTEKSLNDFIRANPLSKPKGQRLGAEAARDPVSFINKYFSLTKAQAKELASLDEADKTKLKDAIQEARAQKGKITASIISPRASNDRQSIFAAEANHLVPMKIKIDITGGRTDDGWEIKITVSKES